MTQAREDHRPEADAPATSSATDPSREARRRRRSLLVIAAAGVLLALVALTVAVSGRDAGDPGTAAVGARPIDLRDWHLVFDDEFSGSSLDTTKWIPCLSAGWTRSEPQPSCPTWGTMLQTYRPRNVTVSNGPST